MTLDKACIIAIWGDPNDGIWGWRVKARLSILGQDIEAIAYWPTNTPSGADWPTTQREQLKILTLIRDAVAIAANAIGSPIDTVMFPDGAIMGLTDTLVPPPLMITPNTLTKALNATWQLSDPTRPGRIVVSGTWTAQVTVLGAITGKVELFSDAQALPTALLDDAQLELSQGLGLVVNEGAKIPWKLIGWVRIGHKIRVSNSGNGTFAITNIKEYPL